VSERRERVRVPRELTLAEREQIEDVRFAGTWQSRGGRGRHGPRRSAAPSEARMRAGPPTPTVEVRSGCGCGAGLTVMGIR